VRYSEIHKSLRLVALCGAWIALSGRVAPAQVANQSDVSGIPITTSSVVSPVFTVAAGGAVRVMTFITPEIANAYQQAAARINAQLASQSFATSQGYRPPPATQNLLYVVASGGPGSAVASSELLRRLMAGNSSPRTISSAQAFVESFRGLLAKGIAMNPRFYNSLAATQLANAVAAFDAFIDASNAAFLASPPPEVPAVHGILMQLTSH
jgi:hypothetical protein